MIRLQASAERHGRIRGLTLLALITLAGACEDDMNDQPRIDPLAGSDFFSDGRGARPVVAGTLDRDAPTDPAFTTGIVNGRLLEAPPLPVTAELLQRGAERYAIMCTPCHSPLGDGDGMIPRRGFRHPPSFHEERLRLAPIGHFYDVMTHGFATMPRYAKHLAPADRWAVAAYIRVLQLSQHAALADVPPDQQKLLERTP